MPQNTFLYEQTEKVLRGPRGLRHTHCLGLQKSKLSQVDFVKLLDESSWANMQNPDHLPVTEPLIHFAVQYWPQPRSAVMFLPAP